MQVGKGNPPEHTKFKKGQTGNPNGRPVKLFSEIAAEWKARGVERATPERVIETFEYLLAVSKAELDEMAKGTGEKPYPAIVQMAAEEMTGKRKREILGDMLDRAHGKATQKQEFSGSVGMPIQIGTPIQITFQTDEPIADAKADATKTPKTAKQ